MNKEELIKKLKELLNDEDDIEKGHIIADALLLEYINDSEITETFEKVSKWYS